MCASFLMMQENRRHARLLKKASKLAVVKLLEIVAMKRMNADKMEGVVHGGTATADRDDATSAPSSASSSSSGCSTSKQAKAPDVAHKPVIADVDAKNSHLPEDEL